MQGTLAHEYVSTQSTLGHLHVSTQDTLVREHVSTQGRLTREYVSTQGMLAGEHVFGTQGTQFSRLLTYLRKKYHFYIQIAFLGRKQLSSADQRNRVSSRLKAWLEGITMA